MTDTIPLDDKLDKCPKLSVHWVPFFLDFWGDGFLGRISCCCFFL